jgi:hypothetical protein
MDQTFRSEHRRCVRRDIHCRVSVAERAFDAEGRRVSSAVAEKFL